MTEREALSSERVLEALGELQRTNRTELESIDLESLNLRPLSNEEEAAICDLVLGDERSKGRAERAPKPGLRSRRRLGATPSIVGGLALAAALAILADKTLLSPGRDRESSWDRASSVSYELVAPPSDAQFRGSEEADARHVFALGRRLTFRLRPSTRQAEPVTVAAFALQGGTAKRIVPEIEVRPSGTAVVTFDTGPGKALDVDPGRWELVFYVSKPGDPAPSERDALSGRKLRSGERLAMTVELER